MNIFTNTMESNHRLFARLAGLTLIHRFVPEV